jgi:hypothetical protein
MTARSLVEALASERPATDRTHRMNLYGWLIGRWIMDATVHLDTGGTHRVRWLGERSRDDGQSWQLQAKFVTRRVP